MPARNAAEPGQAAAGGSDGGAAGGGRVLAIQSSVVHGYVGNKAAVFPLQLLGFDVDPVYSVQFSNHTGYPVVRGHTFDGAHLRELLDGLQSNGLLGGHTHLLTGYINSVSLLDAVAAVAAALRAANPTLTYVCDPVLGDEGKMYVSNEMLEAIKTTLLPLADILVPNQFEACLLTGLPVDTEQQALAAAAALHAKGPHTVIITSLHSPPPSLPGERGREQQQQQQQQEQQEHQQGHQGHITLVASTQLPQQPGCRATFCLRVPRLPGYFTGTGDLLAALLLAHTHRHPGNLAAAVEAAVAGLQGVLAATAAAAGASARDSSAASFQARELRLVQSQVCLLRPDVTLRVQPLEPPGERQGDRLSG